MQNAAQRLLIRLQRDFEEALLFAPVDGQRAVRGDARVRLLPIIIHGVDRFALGVYSRRDQDSRARHGLAEGLARGRVVGNLFRQDVARALQGRLRIHFFRYIVAGQERGIPQPLLHQPPCERFQSFFPRGGGARLALGPEGPVDVLNLGERLRAGKRLVHVRGETALRIDQRADLALALVQRPQCAQPLAKLPEHLVVHAARHLLAVAGDKGDGVACVNQGQDVFYYGGA